MISSNTQLLQLIEHAPKDIRLRLKRRTLKPGEELISQGDSPEHVYVIIDGLVKVSILEANGKEFSFGFFGKGELLGEVELFLQSPFACTIKTLTETHVYSIPKRLFLEWIECDRALNMLIMKEIAVRLYTLSTRTSFQMLYPIEYAVMKILYLSREDAVGITKNDLADYLGITLRSVNRALSSLEAKGVLCFSENSFNIQSKEKLKQELLRYEYA